jgi:IS4 transposase
LINTLITGKDTVEVIRDQIAAILSLELQNQKRLADEAEKKGVDRLKAKKRMKGCGKPPSGAQLVNNRYVIVKTSLLETGAELIVRLYRFRWQIELVFKRLKSLFGYNRIPSKREVSGGVSGGNSG